MSETPPSTDGAPDDAKERFGLAKLAYEEVLDATKHQDDKVGRFLTAIAFLTGAAIAFGTREEVLAVRYDLDGALPLPGILFAAFITLVLIAVVFLLMALGQPLRPPRSRSGSSEQSRLFFLVISQMPLDTWNDAWGSGVTTTQLRSQLTENLVKESHNIAVRAESKYRRTSEAQAVFTIALTLFSLAVALAINVLADPGVNPSSWDLRSRLVATLVLSSVALALGYGWVRSGERYEDWWQKPTLYGLWLLGALVPASLLLPTGTGAAILAFLLLGSECVCWSARWKQKAPRLVMGGLAGALALGALAAVLVESDRWRLAIAFMSVILFEVPRLFWTAFRPGPAAAAPPR